MIETKFYILNYEADGLSNPYMLGSIGTPEKWEWQLYEPSPEKIKINESYTLDITESNIENIGFDYYENPEVIVSSRFLDICNKFSVPYRAIPLKIINKGKEISSSYFYFLPGKSIEAMDKRYSEFTVSKDDRTGDFLKSEIWPNIELYDEIKKFVPKCDISLDLFRCIENLKIIVSERFKLEAEKNKIIGISYETLDDSYSFDIWGTLNDL
ncbi:hypothetical protein EAW52_20295 [Pseudomonas sp. LTJR-52]|uniref:Imm43 family immunity protein n=1 Tax=Pseudomonas sp. LTJR-52 TaxID=2479392 RepID=UPI000EFD7246|nr:hypothetical protein [Pseudomonas sp. LTJR-52]AYN96134.1 hypothetical protein EAW52_20295 [Pseudomonas sp. LTJR-52]